MNESPIIARLSNIRRRIRRRLVVYGVCAVTAGGFLAFLTCVTLDWLLWLPRPLRIFGATCFLAGFVWAVWRWIMRPLRAELDLTEVAAQLERHFGVLADRLSSAVDFLERPDAGSPELMKRVVAHTEGVIHTLPLEHALSLRPLLRQGSWCAGSTLLFACIILAAPQWVRTGAARYLDPLGGTEWPRDVTIVPLTHDRKVPIGGSATLEMRVARGLTPTLRSLVHLREADGATAVLAMQRQADGVFTTTIDGVTRDMQYWFEAGDDSTRGLPGRIRVVRRPEVIEALARVEPPPYAAQRSARVFDLSEGPVHVPVGGQVTVTVRTSKPIAASPEAPVLRLESGEAIPLAIEEGDPQALAARFEVRQDLEFRPRLFDEEGFENRNAPRYALRAAPDSPPSVAVVEPAGFVEVTPHGSIPLEVRALDDFGITRLFLEVEHLGGGPTAEVALEDGMKVVQGPTGVEARVRHVWNLRTTFGESLAPGDLFRYVAVARDNYTGIDGSGQTGQSAEMRVRIISEVEFSVRVRSVVAQVEEQIRRAILDQQGLRDATVRLKQKDAPLEPLNDRQLEAGAAAAAEQLRLVRRLFDLSRRLAAVAGQVEQNEPEAGPMLRQVSSLSRGLSEIARRPVQRAGDKLQELTPYDEPQVQQDAVAHAAAAQVLAVEQLEALVREMGQWGDYQNLTTSAQDLLDRQRNLRTRTHELGRSTLGKAIEALSEEQAAQLIRTRREQELVTDDVERLLARMQELHATRSREDQAAAEAVEAALRAARAHEVSGRSRRAAEALSGNRTAAAAIEQKAAEEAMWQMIAALQKREERQLELLRKRLNDAREQLAALIDQQELLRAATEEAAMLGADEADLESLIGEQRRIRRNAGQLGKDLAAETRLAGVAARIRRAPEPMTTAETELEGSAPAAAEVAQREALALLNEALVELEELFRRTEEQMLRRTLSQIRDELAAMRDAQLSVNDGIARLKADVDAAGRLQRAHAREANRLAREQSLVRGRVDQILPELEKVVVYRWAMERVAEWMEEVARLLNERRIDTHIVATSQRITDELNKLIEAIVQTAALPLDREFEEASGGEGSSTAPPKPVPTLAELLVLKTMQLDINDRSRRLHQSLDLARATEKQLRELEMIGEDQREVRRLTELVTNRARGP